MIFSPYRVAIKAKHSRRSAACWSPTTYLSVVLGKIPTIKQMGEIRTSND